MKSPPVTLTKLGDYKGQRFRYKGYTFVKLHSVDTNVINIPPGQVPALEVPGGLLTALPAFEMVTPVPPGSVDLTLESSDDLVDELFSRFDHVMLAGMRIGHPKPAQFSNVTRWHGNGHTCIGMAWDIAGSIRDDMRKRRRPGDD